MAKYDKPKGPMTVPVTQPDGSMGSATRITGTDDGTSPEDAAKGKGLAGPTASLAADDESAQWGVDPSRTDGEGNPVDPDFGMDRSTFHETPVDGDSRPVVPRDTRPLNDIMEFDHVVEVLPDGSVVDRSDVYAPSLHEDEDGNHELDSDKWELLDGHSGQYGYSGPLMHSSEFIGGGLEQRIREEPGVYVAVFAYPTDGGDGAESWAVARLKGSGETPPPEASPLEKLRNTVAEAAQNTPSLDADEQRAIEKFMAGGWRNDAIERPALGNAIRKVINANPEIVSAAKEVWGTDWDDNVPVYPSEGSAVPADRVGRMEYRRTATAFAVSRCDALDDPNSEDYDPNAREILTMRFGGGDKPPADLGQLAVRLGTSRSDIRQREVKALRKVMNSDPELARMYEQGWDKVGHRFA